MEASDKEIFESVMDAIQARENLEKDGRDDHTDEDGPVHPRPKPSGCSQGYINHRSVCFGPE